jgi:nitroimidazol reductase NimA-like FMN-containing flavoprotein (pyridoxamine 5'-phosphate oxidase superfamily)
MSSPRDVRRADKVMTGARAREMLAGGFAGRLGTVGPDGWPDVGPLLYAWMDGQVYLHHTRARGHRRENVEHDARVSLRGGWFAVTRRGAARSVSRRGSSPR